MVITVRPTFINVLLLFKQKYQTNIVFFKEPLKLSFFKLLCGLIV